ncbi:HAAS signaling domain-containing protein [Paenibacillus tarimensis]|uniref:HAAS signaling domain-containing protein n=1 Tax=Paenibacillus tarimensis TaxID=416012 RepID=UPI001F18771C|nr:hypothetical protein [Paenibacillus tarimensis]MCF2944084.1 hypothetical protein [Paenibacillus tarimensis]
MEIIERYIYAVTQKLPLKQREEIGKEIESLIADMLEERTGGRRADQKDVEQVLMELGAPGKLADQYRDGSRFLIGPELMGTYMTVLKIVLASIAFSMLAVFVIEILVKPGSLLEHFISYLVNTLNACFQGFSWVTITFGLLEYWKTQKGEPVKIDTAAWDLSILPSLPDRQTRINRADSFFSITFTILFSILFISSTDLLGVWTNQGSQNWVVIPLFNETEFQRFLPLILFFLALNILMEGVKLAAGRWSLPLIGLDMVVHILQFILAVVMFSDLSIWNDQFIQQLVSSGLIAAGSEEHDLVVRIWQLAQEDLLFMIGIIFVVHLILRGMKAYRISQPTMSSGTASTNGFK